MQMTKKVLSIVLAVMMVVSMMSVMAVSANAATTVAQIGDAEYTTLASAITAAADGDTIKLVNDTTEAVSISGKELTLDLNGCNITSPSATQPIRALNAAKLTITNSNVAKSENTPTQNAILGRNASGYGSLLARDEGTTVNIEAGYYYGYTGNKTAIHAYNGATVTFYDCVVNGAEAIEGDPTTGKEGKVFYSGLENPMNPTGSYPGTIIVHGGTFNGRMSDSNWGNYVIDGGTFDRNEVVINENPVDENGNRVATASGSMTKIKDGTIEEAGWPADGYMIVKNANNTYGVDGPYAAKIGETGYATLAAAIAAAQNGDTVKLLDNVTEAVSISGKELTLDLNGYNITSPSVTQPIRALNAAKLTITNSNVAKSENTPTQNAILGRNANGYGSLLAKDGSTVDIKAGYYYGYTGNKTAIHAYNGATITFYDCVVNGAEAIDGDPTIGKEGKVFYSGLENPMEPNVTSPGTIIVHGGTFNGRMSDSNWGNYVIDGGTFDRNEIVLNENPVDENGNRLATVDGSMATLPNSPGTFEDAGWLADGYMIVKNANNTYGVDGPYAAKIGETGYATLAAAIAAAQNGDTVKLLADIETASNTAINKNLTLDLNGKSLTCTGDDAVVVSSGKTLNLTNSDTENTGYIYTKNANAVCYGIFNVGGTVNVGTGVQVGYDINKTGGIYNKGGAANVNGGTVYGKGSSYAAIVVAESGASVTVNSGAVTASGTFAISGNGSPTYGGYDITINGGTVTSDTETAIYHPNTGNLTIAGGTITGYNGVYVKAGYTAVTVDGGTIHGTGAQVDYAFDGNGAPLTGDAFVVDNCGYPGGVPAVAISGGTFISDHAQAVSSYIKTDDTTQTGDFDRVEDFISGGNFSNVVPEAYCADGFKPVTTPNAQGKYEVTPKTLQEYADTAYGLSKTLSFVDQHNQSIDVKYKASLLGVQIRNDADGGYQYGDGTDALRFIAAVDNDIIAGASDYGFIITNTSNNKSVKKTCKGTQHNTILAGENDPDTTFFTAAVYNIQNLDQDLKVEFYIEKNGDTATAKYTKDNTNQHHITTNYNAVYALASKQDG